MPNPMTQILPNPKLENRGRRSFSVEYKIPILQQSDAYQHDELNSLLRIPFERLPPGISGSNCPLGSKRGIPS